MPANSAATLRSGRVAATDLPAYCPIKSDGSAASSGDTIIGITEASAKAGNRVSVIVDGSAEAWAGGTIADGAFLQVGASGAVVTQTTGALIGRALNAASAGDKVEILLATAGGAASGSASLTAAQFTAAITSSPSLLSQAATYSVSTGTYGFTYIAGQYFLNVKEGDYIDLAFAEWVAVVRPLAVANQGRVGGLTIPSGNYFMSATTATWTLEPWMNVKAMGVVKLNHNGGTVPTVWIRNDITPLFSMGNDSATNTTPSTTAETNFANHTVLDGANGPFIFQNTLTTGGCAIRYGNGDGVWGTNFTTNTVNSTIMLEVRGLHAMFYDNGIQFTNNNDFCSRWQNCWFSNNNKTIVTSSSSAEINAYEQHSFINFFSGNINTTHVEFNSTGNRDHQLSFGPQCSLTFCAGPVVTINTAAQCRLEMTQMRCENFTYIGYSSVASPRSWIRMDNVTVTPTNNVGASYTTHLRKMFSGTFMLQMSNIMFNITGAPVWNTVQYGQASNQFLCDDTIDVQWSNIRSDDPPGSIATNNYMRLQPVVNSSASLLRNSGFDTDLTGWTTSGTGTITQTTTANEYSSGTGGCKMVFAGQYGAITSEKFAVRPGRKYYANLAARVDAAFTTTTVFLIMQMIWYASDGTTVLRTDTATQNSTYLNWYNRKSATQFYQHPIGTGLLVAPAGAASCSVVVNASANITVGGALTGTLFVDSVVPVEL